MRVGIQDVSNRLAASIDSLCRHLLPNGEKAGPFWEVGSINGEQGKTLKVNLCGEHQGNWCDWNGREHKGDPLDLWAQVKGVPLPEALRQAKEWLGIREPQLPEKTYARPIDDKPPLSETGKVMQWLATERKLEAAVVNRYRVQGDKERKAIVFPSYSLDGQLINRSYRTLSEKKEVWQDKEAAPALFGWQAVSESAFAKREILICEGQIDAMTWAQWGIDALSVPNGSGNKWLDYEWENLEAFRTIYLSFDNDGKTENSLQEAIARLGKHRVRVVRFRYKDANDALKAGVTATEARQWVESSQYVNLPHLVTAEHYAEALAEECFPENTIPGIPLGFTTHPEDASRSFLFRPAELTLWTGVSSHGKSTALNYGMMLLAAKTKRPSLIVSLEMQPAKILKRVAFAASMAITSRGVAREAAKCLSKFLLFCDKVGSIERKELFELIDYAYARYGIAHLAIDSLMRVRGLQEDYPAQNAFVTDLVTFARETGVHVHLVAHPRKQNGHDAPQAHDIAGSGHLRDNADNVLVVWRNREKERKREAKESGWEKMPDARLIVEKDREKGEFVDIPLSYDYFNYRFAPWTPPNNAAPTRTHHAD